MKHVHIPDPADLTGQACAVHGCALKRANAVHVTLEQLLDEVPAIDWYDTDRDTAGKEQMP